MRTSYLYCFIELLLKVLKQKYLTPLKPMNAINVVMKETYESMYNFQIRRKKYHKTPFNDIKSIIIIFVVYLAISKFGLENSVILFLKISIVDMILKFVIFLAIMLFNYFGIISAIFLD